MVLVVLVPPFVPLIPEFHSPRVCRVAVTEHSQETVVFLHKALTKSLSCHCHRALRRVCRVTVTEHSPRVCRVNVTEHSPRVCRVIVTEHSPRVCRVIVTEHSSRVCRVIVTEHSPRVCRVIVTEHSPRVCRVIVTRALAKSLSCYCHRALTKSLSYSSTTCLYCVSTAVRCDVRSSTCFSSSSIRRFRSPSRWRSNSSTWSSLSWICRQ